MNRRIFVNGSIATAALAALPAAMAAQAPALPSVKESHIEGARKIALHYHRSGAMPEHACLYKREYCMKISETVFYG
jgi:hypothetical protein